MKNDIEDKIQNSMSAVKDDISAMETKINACQEEMRQEISVFQEKIKASQAEFGERMACTLDTQLKSVTTQDEQQAPASARVTGDTGRDS
jgi:hypothetical protein